MTQLSLNITPCVSYGPDHFVAHEGLKEVLLSTQCFLSSGFLRDTQNENQKFQIVFVQGGARTGKTHFSIFLCDVLSKAGRYPHLIEATKDLKLSEVLLSRQVTAADVFIIDDAEDYLAALQPGMSGDFVSFIEALRVKGAGVVLLSSEPLESFPCDEHVKSRILPGVGPVISAPLESEVPEMLKVMARQRGMALSDRKVEFLERRLPRHIEQLEAYLDRVQYISHVTGKPVRFPILGDAL
jgi:chromosomal replication initiation ATPase DnaA